MSAPPRHDRVFLAALAVGAVPAGYGLWLVLADPARTAPLATLRRFVVVLLLHDLALAPVVCVTGWLLLRRCGPVWRPPVRMALLVSASVLLVAAWGTAAQVIEVQPGNAHVLPNHYPTSVAWLLAPVWAVAVGWGLVARRRAGRQVRSRRYPGS